MIPQRPEVTKLEFKGHTIDTSLHNICNVIGCSDLFNHDRLVLDVWESKYRSILRNVTIEFKTRVIAGTIYEYLNVPRIRLIQEGFYYYIITDLEFYLGTNLFPGIDPGVYFESEFHDIRQTFKIVSPLSVALELGCPCFPELNYLPVEFHIVPPWIDDSEIDSYNKDQETTKMESYWYLQTIDSIINDYTLGPSPSYLGTFPIDHAVCFVISFFKDEFENIYRGKDSYSENTQIIIDLIHESFKTPQTNSHS